MNFGVMGQTENGGGVKVFQCLASLDSTVKTGQKIILGGKEGTGVGKGPRARIQIRDARGAFA